MKIHLILLTISFTFIYVKGDCTLNTYVSINKSPIYLQKIGKELLLLPINDEILKLGQFTEIIAVCPSGFENLELKNDDYQPYTNNEYIPYTGDSNEIILKCINGDTKIRYENSFKNFRNLKCVNSAKSEIYEITSRENCNKKTYTVGLNIQGVPIIFANICYDLDNMKLNFIHYVSTLMSPVLSRHNHENFNLSTKAEAPAESFFIEEPSAHTLVRTLIGNQADFVRFKYEELYPSDNLSPFIATPLETAGRLNRFLGWTSFIQGNWKSFRNLLKLRSQNITYDVYLGTSDVVIAPTNDECKSLKKLELKEFSKVVAVPMYVWAYLKSKQNETDEFVVIGVNSPYFDFFPRNETIFCDDICHEIDWFAPMEMFRKISTFGYTFCCKKEQVQQRLDGFPFLNTINTTAFRTLSLNVQN